MTSVDDIELAVAAGADAVGIILAPSARRVPLGGVAALAAAIPPFVSRIGVLVDQGDEEASLLRRLGFTLQFSGRESPADCARLSGGAPYLKVFHVDPAGGGIDTGRCESYAGATWMFDTHVAGRAGGSGVAFDWHALKAVARLRPIVVSGGLTAENVGACVRTVRPFAVDVRSGIESGERKDAAKMRAFVAAVEGERA